MCEFYGIWGRHYEKTCRILNHQHNFIKGRVFQFPPSPEPAKELCDEETTQNAVGMLPMGHVVLLGAQKRGACIIA